MIGRVLFPKKHVRRCKTKGPTGVKKKMVKVIIHDVFQKIKKIDELKSMGKKLATT